ncbi:MAG TPA: carboxypeptidase-like regulatory domain-containing protein, partial [Terracidiphilus sp.]|nr:carboxypeptidase-like regulatory domain-containing protein [Terracidiphilus sp.]
MAGSWAKTLAVAVLLMGAGAAGFTQSPQIEPAENDSTGALTGKLTDLYSRPLEGVAVVVRNQATGAEARTITTKNGVYRFSGLEPGEYTLTAESPQLGRGQVKWIVVAAGHEARVQVALEFALPPPGTELAALPERKQPWLNRPILEPEALPRSDAELASEPLQLLPLSGQRVIAQIPLTSTFELNATLKTEPLRTLALAGRNLPNTLPIKAASQESGPATPALSTAMSATELQALPVSGRRWQDFVLDNTPTSTTPAGGQGEISLRGAGLPTEIAVDGISRELAFGRTNEPGQGSSGRGPLGQGENPAGMAQVGKGGHGIAVSEAAIRTVEMVAGNVEAATDRAAGGRMNVETQHGANELHGQVFFFDRQNTWGAQNP